MQLYLNIFSEGPLLPGHTVCVAYCTIVQCTITIGIPDFARVGSGLETAVQKCTVGGRVNWTLRTTKHKIIIKIAKKIITNLLKNYDFANRQHNLFVFNSLAVHCQIIFLYTHKLVRFYHGFYISYIKKRINIKVIFNLRTSMLYCVL